MKSRRTVSARPYRPWRCWLCEERGTGRDEAENTAAFEKHYGAKHTEKAE